MQGTHQMNKPPALLAQGDAKHSCPLGRKTKALAANSGETGLIRNRQGAFKLCPASRVVPVMRPRTGIEEAPASTQGYGELAQGSVGLDECCGSIKQLFPDCKSETLPTHWAIVFCSSGPST